MIWNEDGIRDRVRVRQLGGEAALNARPVDTNEAEALLAEIDRLRKALRASCHQEKEGLMYCWDYIETRKKEGVVWTREMIDECTCTPCKALEGLPR